jgi:hypothetical protein
MTGYRAIAAALEALARWIDDQLAGGGPAKWVAQQASTAAREIARQAREDDKEARP